MRKRYRGNPFSSNLKRSIQVESWFEKEKEPGSVEIDLVHHSGSIPEGQFIYTLTAELRHNKSIRNYIVETGKNLPEIGHLQVR